MTTTAEHMAALWKEVAREHVARSSSARRYARACHDSMDAAIRRANKAERALASAEFDAATHRAARDAAEEERDEALDALRDLGAAHRALQGLAAEIGRAEQPRALTPDAITDDMRERFLAAYMATDGAMSTAIRAGLEAMLTEPEPRPEGAEEISLELDRWDEEWGEANHRLDPEERDALADYLAERGVRVVTEKEARHATDE